MTEPLTIWINAGLPERAMAMLQSGVAPHKLTFAAPTGTPTGETVELVADLPKDLRALLNQLRRNP